MSLRNQREKNKDFNDGSFAKYYTFDNFLKCDATQTFTCPYLELRKRLCYIVPANIYITAFRNYLKFDANFHLHLPIELQMISYPFRGKT